MQGDKTRQTMCVVHSVGSAHVWLTATLSLAIPH